MPSQRKRIGFLPSEKVHEIIDLLCKANKYSQSKVTGLLVEEALRSRGVLCESFSNDRKTKKSFINYSFDQELSSKNDKSTVNGNDYLVDKKTFSDLYGRVNSLCGFAPRVNRPLSIDRSTDAPFALQLFEMALQAQLGERPQKGGRVVVDVSNQRGSLSGLRRFQRLQRFLLSLQAMITQPKQGLSTTRKGEAMRWDDQAGFERR